MSIKIKNQKSHCSHHLTHKMSHLKRRIAFIRDMPRCHNSEEQRIPGKAIGFDNSGNRYKLYDNGNNDNFTNNPPINKKDEKSRSIIKQRERIEVIKRNRWSPAPPQLVGTISRSKSLEDMLILSSSTSDEEMIRTKEFNKCHSIELDEENDSWDEDNLREKLCNKIGITPEEVKRLLYQEENKEKGNRSSIFINNIKNIFPCFRDQVVSRIEIVRENVRKMYEVDQAVRIAWIRQYRLRKFRRRVYIVWKREMDFRKRTFWRKSSKTPIHLPSNDEVKEDLKHLKDSYTLSASDWSDIEIKVDKLDPENARIVYLPSGVKPDGNKMLDVSMISKAKRRREEKEQQKIQQARKLALTIELVENPQSVNNALLSKPNPKNKILNKMKLEDILMPSTGLASEKRAAVSMKEQTEHDDEYISEDDMKFEAAVVHSTLYNIRSLNPVAMAMTQKYQKRKAKGLITNDETSQNSLKLCAVEEYLKLQKQDILSGTSGSLLVSEKFKSEQWDDEDDSISLSASADSNEISSEGSDKDMESPEAIERQVYKKRRDRIKNKPRPHWRNIQDDPTVIKLIDKGEWNHLIFLASAKRNSKKNIKCKNVRVIENIHNNFKFRTNRIRENVILKKYNMKTAGARNRGQDKKEGKVN